MPGGCYVTVVKASDGALQVEGGSWLGLRLGLGLESL